MKGNMKVDADKKKFQQRNASRRRHWETAHFILLCNKKGKWRFIFFLKDQAKGVFSMCYELIHRGTNIF